jgi:hypothetical protein
MKPTSSVALATWMLDRFTLGARNESLSGDLLEEFHSGRSTAWYWRQALSAVAVAFSAKSRAYVLPLIFSAGWSIIYPAIWPSLLASSLMQRLLQQMAVHNWPYSSGLQVVSGITPAAIFIWIGFFIYLTSSSETLRRLSVLRLLVSLSISLNVLSVATIVQHLLNSGAYARDVPQQNFSSHLVPLSIPLALSLFSALMCALPPVQQRNRNNGSVTV